MMLMMMVSMMVMMSMNVRYRRRLVCRLLLPPNLLGDLHEETREARLLHGTCRSNLLDILAEGLNERFSRRGYFDCGNDFCEDAGKTGQHVDPHGDLVFDEHSPLHALIGCDCTVLHPASVHYILLFRVALRISASSYDGETTIKGWVAHIGDRKYGRKQR